MGIALFVQERLQMEHEEKTKTVSSVMRIVRFCNGCAARVCEWDDATERAVPAVVNLWIDQFLHAHVDTDELQGAIDALCTAAVESDLCVRRLHPLARVVKLGIEMQDAPNGRVRKACVVLEFDGSEWSYGIDTDFDNPCLRNPAKIIAAFVHFKSPLPTPKRTRT
jgi:hypothetical protein